jgi:transcription-repair coupling factor (superfamily II helicase)
VKTRSLNGLRTALAEDKSFERIRLYASRPAGERSEDLQIGAPPGLRAALLAEMVEGQESGVVLAVTATGRDIRAAVAGYRPSERDAAGDDGM